MKPLQVGELVEHAVWGRGKVLAVDHQNADVYFPSQAGTDRGPEAKVRLQMLTRSEVQSDPAIDAIDFKPTAGGKVKASVPRPRKRPDHDLEQAIDWFRKEYPGLFGDEKLVKDELTYKREAHGLYVDRLGEGRGRQLLAEANGAEAGQVLDAIWRHTNIPSRFEIMAAHDGLKDAGAALGLLEALLDFLEAPGADAFARLSGAVAALPAPASGSRVHTWPNVTILPFLADPSRFIVTKPEITKKVAARMGRDLQYSTAVKWDTYARVLDLSQALQETLEPLGARDYIDVQSFVWVTRTLA